MGLLGTPNRSVRGAPGKTLYLTFDDGPRTGTTEGVLDVLAQQGAAATFFLVAERARQAPQVARRIVEAGHGVGNHSLDHRYHHLFRGPRHVRQWIADGEAALADVTGAPTVGFRPPAGVVTPDVVWGLRDLATPLVLWRLRFFDTVVPWRRPWAVPSLRLTPHGAIVLLHDVHRDAEQPRFLRTLDAYLAAARAQGWAFAPLTRALLVLPS